MRRKKKVFTTTTFFTCSPKDSTDEFNLSKTDLNVFLLPFAVCGRQHRLQEPEERGP